MAMKSLFKKKVTSLMMQRRQSRSHTQSRSSTGSTYNEEEGNKGPQIILENTFQLEPKDSQKFPTKKAENIIKDNFQSHLLDVKYNSDTCKNLTTQITETIKTQIKAELGSNNRFAQFEYHNDSLFAVGVVYGVYYE